MLKQLARLERTRKYLIFGFAVIMAVSLVIFYAPGRSSHFVEPAKSTEVIARVGSEEITVSDLALAKQSLQQRFGGQISLAQLGLNNRRMLDELIQKQIMMQEARRLELTPSEAEVANEIRKEFKDRTTGQYINLDPDKDRTRYTEIAVANAGGVEAFEQQFRDQLTIRNIRAFITASIVISDEAVQSDYQRKNTSFDLTYVVVSADKLAEKLKVTEEELKSYYDQHKADYHYNEPQKRIRYIYISSEKVGEKLQIPESELHDAYDNLAPQFKEAGVKVQQIFLRVARKDLDSQVEQRAVDLITKLRGPDGTSTEETFAEAARGNSEDLATAKNGGFLPRLVKKNPNKTDALYDRAVDMRPGEVSDIPIKYAGNWYILRRGDAVPKTFEQAKPELLVSARNRAAYAATQKLAERAHNRLNETHDPQKVAQELADEANMKPAEMVKETQYVMPGDDVTDIGNNQKFHDAIAPLNNPNDVGQETGVKGGFAIPMLVDKKEPRTPEFDEVKTKVETALKQQRAREQVESKAREIAASAATADQVKAAGERAGFETDTEETYKLGAQLGKLGTSPAIDEAIYALKSGEVTSNPVLSGGNWIVLGATKRTEADLAEFAKQRDQLKQSMLSTRQSQVFGDYINAVQKRMTRDGKITVYDDILARLEEEEPIAAPPPGGFPFPTK